MKRAQRAGDDDEMHAHIKKVAAEADRTYVQRAETDHGAGFITPRGGK